MAVNAVKYLLLMLVLVTSAAPARAQADRDGRRKLVMLVAAPSYETDRTLPAFAAAFLAEQFNVVTVDGAMTNPRHEFSGIEELSDADILLVSVWRRTPPKTQLERIRRYIEAGKPVVGICTASHAFARRKGVILGDGAADWPEWDARVIGGSYSGHHPIGYVTTVVSADAAHPILDGVALPFTSRMELNQVTPLQPGAHALLTGTIAGRPPEPVAWTFTHYGKGKTFFTPLGHPEDFENPAFQRLLLNGIRWAANMPVDRSTPATLRDGGPGPR
jgi:type 1 glutamine amidotransferase